MAILSVILFSILTPVSNITNHSLFYHRFVNDTSFILSSNGGIIEGTGIKLFGDSAWIKSSVLLGSVNGLPTNIIKKSIVDNNNILWCLTLNSGIYFKEKNNFEYYYIPIPGIKSALDFEISDNLLFVQMPHAIYRINLNNNYLPEDDTYKKVFDDSVSVMRIYDDTIFFARSDTLYSTSPDFTDYSIYSVMGSPITGIWKSMQDSLLIGTQNGLFRPDNSLFFSCTGPRDIYSINDTTIVSSESGTFLIDNQGSAQIGDKSSICFYFDGCIVYGAFISSSTYYNAGLKAYKDGRTYAFDKGLITNFITTMERGTDRLFLGTLDWSNQPAFLTSKAFWIKDDSTGQVDSIDNSTKNAVRIIERNTEGDIFIGTYAETANGLFIVHPDLSVEHIINLPSLRVTDVFAGRDTLIALWRDGIYRINGGVAHSIDRIDYPSQIIEDNFNRIWVGTEASGINVYSKSGTILQTFTSQLPSPAVTRIAVYNNYVFAGTDYGLVRFDSTFSHRTFLLGKRIRDIAFDNIGRMFCLGDSALYVMNPANGDLLEQISSPPIIPITAEDWEVRNVLATNGTYLYVGGKQGIIKFNINYPFAKTNEHIFVYPNPCKQGNYLTICRTKAAIHTAYIFRLDGKLMKKLNFNAQNCIQERATEFTPSLYYILTTEDHAEKSKFLITK